MKCWGEWYGGSSYGPPYPEDREEFASLAEAERIFISRYRGWDPVGKLSTPCVDESSHMKLYSDADGKYPYGIMVFGPQGGIRVDFDL